MLVPANSVESGAPKATIPRRTSYMVAVGIFVSLLMGALDNLVVTTTLPSIATDLGQPSGVAFVVSGYLVSTTVAIPIFARLSDMVSRRNVFLLGLLTFMAGSALSGTAQSLAELVAFRGVQGFGAGAFLPVGYSIIAVLFPPATRAKITGMLGGTFGIATAFGPLLGSFIVDHTTWRWAFYINLPVGMAGAALVAFAIGPLRAEKRAPFDALGAVTLGVWVGALVLTLYEVSVGSWGWTSPFTLGLLALAAVIGVAFLRQEVRSAAPLVPLRHFRERVVAASCASAFLAGTWFFASITMTSVFVGEVLFLGGPSAANSVRDCLYFLVLPMVLAAGVSGQILSRVPYRVLETGGMLLASAGLLSLTRITSATPLWSFAYGFLPDGGIILSLLAVGGGMGMTLPVPTLAVQFKLPSDEVGAATGMVQFLSTLGGSLGLSALATFQQWRFHALDPIPATTCPPHNGTLPSVACSSYLAALPGAAAQSFADVYWVLFVLALLAAVAGLGIRGRLPKSSKSDPASSPP